MIIASRARWAEQHYPNPNEGTGPAALFSAKFVPVPPGGATITTGVGGVSIIGGPFTVTVSAENKLAIIATAQVSVSPNELAQIIHGLLVIDGVAVPEQPAVQPPVALGIFDGSMLTIVWETGPLTAGDHTVDFQASTIAPSNCLAFTGGVLVMRVSV